MKQIHLLGLLFLISYLLVEAKEHEKERLLLKVIPDKYFNLLINDDKLILPALVECFRLPFEAVSEETKKKVMKEFIRILKEENSNNEWRYAFFRGICYEFRRWTSLNNKQIKPSTPNVGEG